MVHLGNHRILVTQVHDFMGPALCEVLRRFDADAVADPQVLRSPDAALAVVKAAGPSLLHQPSAGEGTARAMIRARRTVTRVACLCSPQARCFVGQVFPVSGGWLSAEN
jgi:hypothetical protein